MEGLRSLNSTSSSALLERERELDVLYRALSSARQGAGSLVAIEGHAGLGKTVLLAETAARAGSTGVDVLWARCLDVESDHSMGVALQLFERRLAQSGSSDWAKTFVGAARQAKSLFVDGPSSQTKGDFSLLHGLYSLTSNLAQHALLLICVDDAQWADGPSLRFLRYLAHRLHHLPVALVIARRPNQPNAREDLLTELASDPTATDLRLVPLSRSAVDRYVRERLPQAHETFRRACHRETQGNPFVLEHVLAAVESLRAEPTAEMAERIGELASPSLLRWTALQLQRLPPGCLKLARAVSLLGEHAWLHTAATLAGLAPDAAAQCADILSRTGFIDTDDPLSFVQPLLGCCVDAERPAAERARAHNSAARLLAIEGATPDAIGRHLLAGSSERDVWTVERLRQAATDALARGVPDSAVLYLRRALTERPPADLRVHVLVELGNAEALAGAAEAALRLQEAVELTEAGKQKAKILCQLGWLRHKQGLLADAADVFERALYELGGNDEALADDLTAGYRTAKLMDQTRTRDSEARLERMSSERPIDSSSGTPGLLSAVIAWRLFKGEHSNKLVPVAEHITKQTRLFECDAGASTTLLHTAACLSWSDALELSEGICSTALQVARQRESVLMMADARFARAWPRYWMGRLDEAAADARAAVEAWPRGFDLYLPAAAYWLALAHIERDELEQAAAALTLQSTEERWSKTGWYSLLLAGRGRLAIARHDFKAAYAALSAAGEFLVPLTTNPAVLAWRSDAALAANRLGDSVLARKLVEDELQLARSFGAPRPIGVALRAAGLLRGGQPGIALLREAIATLERSPAKLELARTLLDLGAALRRAGHRTEAREMLRRGLRLTECFGAHALDRRGRDELVAAGARPRRRSLSGAESLTGSERRVAEMATRGLTNSEIAETLVVTRKTVRFHLGNIYKKLEISSRDELRSALRTDSD